MRAWAWILLALIIITAFLGFSGLFALTAAIFRLLFAILVIVLVALVILRFVTSLHVRV